MSSQPSFDQLANEKRLTPFQSWNDAPPPGYVDLPLAPSAAPFFQDNGYLVVQNAFTPQETESTRAEALAICRGERGIIQGLIPANAQDTDDEVMERYLCIHFPHKVSPATKALLAHPSLVQTLTALIGPDVKCMQSMLFIKSSGKPGQAWHQDEIYIPTRDRSLTGAWIALDDATVENGCLWVIPGSHRPGVLYHQAWHADPRFDCALEAQRFPYSDDQAVPVEVKAGSVVFFTGYLLHRSLPNYAESGYRRALVNHYMSAQSLLPWSDDGVNKSSSAADYDFRDITLVAGEDPYAWKGTLDIHKPHVRPSGKGGCGNLEYNLADQNPAETNP